MERTVKEGGGEKKKGKGRNSQEREVVTGGKHLLQSLRFLFLYVIKQLPGELVHFFCGQRTVFETNLRRHCLLSHGSEPLWSICSTVETQGEGVCDSS